MFTIIIIKILTYHILMCVLIHFSCVQLFATQCTLAHQAPLSMGFSRQEYWNGLPSSRGSSQPRDHTHISDVSCNARQIFFYH